MTQSQTPNPDDSVADSPTPDKLTPTPKPRKTATTAGRVRKPKTAAPAKAAQENNSQAEADSPPAKPATRRKSATPKTARAKAPTASARENSVDAPPPAEAPPAKAASARGGQRGRKSATTPADEAPAKARTATALSSAAGDSAYDKAPASDRDSTVEGAATLNDAAKTPARAQSGRRSSTAGSGRGKRTPAKNVRNDSPAHEQQVQDSPAPIHPKNDPASAAPKRDMAEQTDAKEPESSAAPEPREAPQQLTPAPKAKRSLPGKGRKTAAAEEAIAPDAVQKKIAPEENSASPENQAPPLTPEVTAAPAALKTPVSTGPELNDIAVEAPAPADFPSFFDEWGSEQSSGEQAETGENAEEGDEPSAKKRRGRSRRGGRGRKKTLPASEQAAEQQTDATREEADDAETAEAEEQPKAKPDIKEDKVVASRCKMFVSILPEEQVEVVITEEGHVLEYYVEMLHQAKIKGNIYKATVHNVDPNLQAAFVSYGAVKNGFLQIDEVHPEYYTIPHDVSRGRKYPLIQKVLRPGQELLVQVVKEPAGTKGAFLTTYLSMPGRFLVLTPGREQVGVSRKVDDDAERSRLRDLLEGLTPGPGLGVIVRTVSMGASKTSLQRDLQFLKRTWKDVRTKGTTEKAPCLIYQEMDLTSRAVRDYLTDAIGEVWLDDEETAGTITEIAEALFPRKRNLVRTHKDHSMTLFERFNLQRQLDQIHSREVLLPSGGRLVIDPTEALTAIDINSGRSGGKNNFEDMAYRTNMEAAKMIPLQLRLRDIGGQIVADFIEMRDKNHWREVEKTLRSGMKVDRARYDVGKIGPFGMLEIVRQRLGSSAISLSTESCPCCNGTGVRRNMEWQSQRALREILRLLRNSKAQNQTSVTYDTDQRVALYLLNHKRQRLLDMERQHGVQLDIKIRIANVE